MWLFFQVAFVGWIAGMVTAAFIAIVLAYFRAPLISKMTAIEAKAAMAGPRPKGFIIDPEPEEDIIRREHIKANAERGRDTPLSELM